MRAPLVNYQVRFEPAILLYANRPETEARRHRRGAFCFADVVSGCGPSVA
jgi:hypothetical protein